MGNNARMKSATTSRGCAASGRQSGTHSPLSAVLTQRFPPKAMFVLAQNCRRVNFKTSLVNYRLRQLRHRGGLRLAREAARSESLHLRDVRCPSVVLAFVVAQRQQCPLQGNSSVGPMETSVFVTDLAQVARAGRRGFSDPRSFLSLASNRI